MAYWRDKVAVVTGSSRGFGKVLATSLAQAGARVVLSGRDEARVQEVYGELQATGAQLSRFPADVVQAEAAGALIRHAVETWGKLDLLVNNVGQSDRGRASETAPDRFRQLWETNVLSALHCTQAALPHVRASRGHLVFMGSLAGKAGSPYLGAYPASKFPLTGLAQQLRLEEAEYGTHILLVCPGPIARDDEGMRYHDRTAGLPASAHRPGGGVKLRGLVPARLAAAILAACERRQAELILPAKARLLFALMQCWPWLGDWLIRRATS